MTPAGRPQPRAAARRRAGGHWAAALLVSAGLLPGALAAQDPVPDGIDVAGVVADLESGAPIAGAVVELPDAGRKAVTNEQGRFVLLGLPPGEQRWRIRMLGYATWEERTTVADLDVLTIGLLPKPVELERISVVADRLEARRELVGVSVAAVDREELVTSTWTSATDVVRSRIPYVSTRCPAAGADALLQEAPWDFCIKYRSRIVRPVVFIDEREVPLATLYDYHPAELYAVEIYPAISGRFTGPQIRMYTTAFMKRGGRLRPMTTY